MRALSHLGRAPLAAIVLALACTGPRASAPDGAAPRLEFGADCVDASECESGLCVATGESGAVCSRACARDSDCPWGDNWGCIQPAEYPELRVCACLAGGALEVCADGDDNDCNGRVDDCLRCGDVLVAGDDDEHCGACFSACSADEECRAGQCRCRERSDSVCDGRCVDLASDARNCGACGAACDTGRLCVSGACACPAERPDECGDACTDTARDPSHCGACGAECAPGLECLDGRCACPAERPDQCGDACVDTMSDGEHCGGCGAACPSGLVCRSGTCECTSTTVSDVCDGVGCVDLDTDPAHCGACGSACSSGLVCRGGACACRTTGAPDHCPGVGCVSLDRDALHCGACGAACPAGQSCQAGSCMCPSSSEIACGGECVDPRWDARHCGGCGIACRLGERCTSGACVCPSGIVCDGVCVSVGPSNCGGCGITCGSGQVCSGGACTCPLAGQTQCPDGCFDLSSDPAHCGSCGAACSGGRTCASGTCVCPSGRTWCEALGRCLDLARDDASCGSCGNACPAGTTCSGGACNCPVSGQRYCDSAGACVDTLASDAHCGACDRACPSDASCAMGACVCSAGGHTICAGSCVDRQTDEAHCGVCDRACAAGTECRAGACACPAPIPGAPHRLTHDGWDVDLFRVASSGSEAAVVYLDGVSTVKNVVFQRLASDGAPIGPPLALTTYPYPGGVTPDRAFYPDIVWTGADWAVIWAADDDAGYRLELQRISASGSPSGASIAIPATSPTGTTTIHHNIRLLHSPATGFSLAARQRSSDVVVRALGDGTAPAPPVVVASGGFFEAAVAPDGTIGLLYQTGTSPYVMNFLSVGSDGTPTGAAIPLTTSFYHYVSEPQVAHDGAGFVLAYVLREVITPSPALYEWSVVLRSRPSGGVQRKVTSYRTDAPVSRLRHPSLRLNGTTALIVWEHIDETERDPHLRMRRARLGSGVTLLEPETVLMPLPVVDVFPGSSTAAWTGATSAVAVWPDLRWGTTELYDLGVTLPACP